MVVFVSARHHQKRRSVLWAERRVVVLVGVLEGTVIPVARRVGQAVWHLGVERFPCRNRPRGAQKKRGQKQRDDDSAHTHYRWMRIDSVMKLSHCQIVVQQRMRASGPQRAFSVVLPSTYGRRISGMPTEPSSFWHCSMMATSARLVAMAVELRVCTAELPSVVR